MAAIYKKEKVNAVWQAIQKDLSRSEVAAATNIKISEIDCYIAAAYRKYHQPRLIYETLSTFKKHSRNTIQKAPALYSNRSPWGIASPGINH